ncbi:oxidoreductase [Enterobacter mori]|uniref:oxidoreductase n=1 Tax=Enterobacter mori TaxID=539813 RepID=UPI00292F46FD|nr:hypothetical protein [Enterobacter mori]
MFAIKNLTDKNIYFLAVNTGYGNNGEPNDELIEFYKKRSGNGINCSIVGNVVIPNGYGSNQQCLFISKSEKWKHLSQAINDNNTIAGIQLSSTWPNYIGNRNFVAVSEHIGEKYLSLLSEIKLSDIDKIIDQLDQGIHLCIENGFKHIQLHAGHGYLFSLLIDHIFCKHSEYALNKIEKAFKNLPNDIETSLRFSLLVGIQKLDKRRKKEQSIENMLSLPFDHFDISFGFYNINKHMIYPETNSMLSSRIKKSLELSANNPNKNFIISGRALKNHVGKLPDNTSLGICRDIIANPNFLNSPNISCDLCNKCHYYSRGELSLTCGKW